MLTNLYCVTTQSGRDLISLLKFTQTEICLTWNYEMINILENVQYPGINVLEGVRLGRNLALPSFNRL